ncbi:hypothetical protein [Streptomyces sp. CA-106131]|uniref:hypothetical protein n=1 Tax=Streptomyces sp. CA-106131 TaxID=3240045 RepID=UPI003D8E871E
MLDLQDFGGSWGFGSKRVKSGGDDGMSERGEHVLERGVLLGGVPGAARRWSAKSAVWLPNWLYHSGIRLVQITANGTVRSTAARVRLRACPAPTN